MQSYLSITGATYKSKAARHVDTYLMTVVGLAVCGWGASLAWLWIA
ncbi:hypothetical protein [Pseudomonas sp. Marseille-Q5115]|nr:hypothetical protein [Pseudomonas sp. Marseille-Q5115]